MGYRILAIETSCDETAVACLNGDKVCKARCFSQIDLHEAFGVYSQRLRPGVIWSTSGFVKDVAKPDLIAVTAGPGLLLLAHGC